MGLGGDTRPEVLYRACGIRPCECERWGGVKVMRMVGDGDAVKDDRLPRG